MNDTFLGLPVPVATALLGSAVTLLIASVIAPLASPFWTKLLYPKSKLHIQSKIYNYPWSRYRQEAVLAININGNSEEERVIQEIMADAISTIAIKIENKGKEKISNLSLTRIGKGQDIIVERELGEQTSVFRDRDEIALGDVRPGLSVMLKLHSKTELVEKSSKLWKLFTVSADHIEKVTYENLSEDERSQFRGEFFARISYTTTIIVITYGALYILSRLQDGTIYFWPK